jgi:hypothetical protein
MRLVFDKETSDLLNSNSVDYTASPYKLKDSFKVHSTVFINADKPEEEFIFVGDETKRVKEFILDTATELIGHNIINFDLMVGKAAFGAEFKIGVNQGRRNEKFYDTGRDSYCGKPITITDTLVMSKTLNPDRVAHSIEYFGKLHGEEKIDWRAKAIQLGLIKHDAPAGAEFKEYHPEMLVYNKQDVRSNLKTWKFLLREWGDWDWRDAYELEKKVAFIIVHQEHRGFWFDKEKAIEHVKELDEKMEALRQVVEPLIPPKPLGITAAKQYIPPVKQFKKDGTPNAHITNFVEKHGGKIEFDPGLTEGQDRYVTTLYEKDYILPIPQSPIVTHCAAKINDTTHIKGWLVELGWNPSAYKERDLTVDSKKHKLTKEQYIATCDRYIEQTLNSPFKKDRMELLEVESEAEFKTKLYKHDHLKRPLKVYTNPTLTVGMEKEIDPNLLLLADKFSHAKDVSDYLTYRHRRNSILGGGIDPDDEDEEASKGWLSVERINIDHRIPTPADTCGAGTSRFKHRLVANIPRVTSPYGKEMRELFGVDVADGFFQLGYDFASLEAMVEAHFCWLYDNEDKTYCKSLTLEKPNDVHTITAKKISEVLGREFKRTPSKNVKYCCAYGGQPKRVAKTVGCSLMDGEIIFNAYWEAAQPLAKLMDKLKNHWEKVGGKKFIKGIDGRKIPTRSAGALVNSLFQSTGVICAKRAMVIHYDMLEERGLLVDFWEDDWKRLAFVQQLIAYHDEGQMEVHKSLIKWKRFDTEEKAKEFKKANQTWSEIGHSERGYYLGWCEAGELIQKAVRDTSTYYKLNVTLSADYILGRNWAECH